MKKNLERLSLLLLGMVLFVACNSNDDPEKEEKIIISHGVCFVNEGSYFSKINGTMDYWNTDLKKMERNVFERINHRWLGGTANSAVVCNKKIYIAVTEEERVEVISEQTFKAGTSIEVASPRHVVADGKFVYASSYDGKVRKIDAGTDKIVAVSEKVGDHLEQLTVLNGMVYVTNSWDGKHKYYQNVVQLNASDLKKVKDIEVTLNPTRICNDGKNVYLISMGNYGDVSSSLQKIDRNGKVSRIAPATMMSYNAKSKKLYFVNAPNGGKVSYNVYDVATGKVAEFIDGKEIFSPYSISVDPKTEDVFITSQSKDPDTGYASYTSDGYVVRYDSKGTYKSQQTVGVNPGSMFFI